MNILCVVPTELEHQLFLDAWVSLGVEQIGAAIGRLSVTNLPSLNITVAQGGLGKVNFAVHTQHLIEVQPDWSLVACVGAAGGLDPAVPVGDVVAATETLEHDIKNNFGLPLMPRYAGDPATLTALQALDLQADFQLRFGPVASGDEDVISAERQAQLRTQTNAIAVAWEGAGGANACQFSGVPYLELRGVSDSANHDAASDFVANLPAVMYNLAIVLHQFAKSG